MYNQYAKKHKSHFSTFSRYYVQNEIGSNDILVENGSNDILVENGSNQVISI